MSWASPRTPCSGPKRRASWIPAASRWSTAWTRSAVTLAGWQSNPTRRPRTRSCRSAAKSSSPVKVRGMRSVDADGAEYRLVALLDQLETHQPAAPLLLEAGLRQAELGHEGGDAHPVGGLARRLEGAGVFVEEPRVVGRLALGAEGSRAGRGGAVPLVEDHVLGAPALDLAVLFLDGVLVGLVATEQAGQHHVEAVGQPLEVGA